jgi:hypothetical protein
MKPECSQRLRDGWRAAGLCIRCGRHSVAGKGYTSCFRCRLINSASKRRGKGRA